MTQAARVNVSYQPYQTKRLWLKDNEFDTLHSAIAEGCALLHPLSRNLPITNSPEIRYYDIHYPDLNFALYDTDTYPPDEYISTFFHAHDHIPGPFGDLGELTGESEFERLVSLHHGKIQHNPDHGRHNYSQTKSPRLRKSVFVEKWGLEADHIFRAGRPTNEFRYSVLASDLVSAKQGLAGLIVQLELSPVTDADIRTLPAYVKLCQRFGTVEFEHQRFHEQKFDTNERRWRGFINAKVKSGFFSTEWSQIYIE